MKLIYSDASPYARTARVLVRELGLTEQVEELALHPFDNPQALIDGNPLCKVPCLIAGSGESIFDSQVICEYLDAKAGNLLFQNFANDWSQKTLYSLTRGLLDSAVAWQQDKMRGDDASDFWQKRFISSIERGLSYLAERVSSEDSITGLTINLICLLDYLSFRHPEFLWQENYPTLKIYYDVLAKRTSFLETLPK